MSDTTWQHLIALAASTIPAIIAAVSSLRNGKRLKDANGSNVRYVEPDIHRRSRRTEN